MKRTSKNDKTSLPEYGLIVDGQVYEWRGNDYSEETEEVKSTHGSCSECDLHGYCGNSPYNFLPCLSLYDKSTREKVVNDRRLKFSNFKKYK